MGFELQPNEHQLARHGAWYAAIKCVDVSAFGKTLYFWRVGHDQAGNLAHGHSRSVDDAADTALAELARWSSQSGERGE